jgi:hypothetical protein
VREIERQRAFGDGRFPSRTIGELNLFGVRFQVAGKQQTERSSPGSESFAIVIKSKSRRPGALVFRQNIVEDEMIEIEFPKMDDTGRKWRRRDVHVRAKMLPETSGQASEQLRACLTELSLRR